MFSFINQWQCCHTDPFTHLWKWHIFNTTMEINEQCFPGLQFICLFQILTIPVKALIAVGTLSCSPKQIILPPSFPVSKITYLSFFFLSSVYLKVPFCLYFLNNHSKWPVHWDFKVMKRCEHVWFIPAFTPRHCLNTTPCVQCHVLTWPVFFANHCYF